MQYPGRLEFVSDGGYAGAPRIWPSGIYKVTNGGRLLAESLGGMGVHDVPVTIDELRTTPTLTCTRFNGQAR